MSEHVHSAIIVIGAGPAGLATALALARVGKRVTLIAPRPTLVQHASDTRTFAALGGSVEFLRRLGVLSHLDGHTAPLAAIRMIDARGGLVRAPEVLFEATEVGLSAFGINIPHAALSAALMTTVDATSAVTWLDDIVTGVSPQEDRVIVTMSQGRSIEAPLVAAADGRNSPARIATGIRATAWRYPQSAIACVFAHTRSHNRISTEFHGVHGPLTTVPMPDGPDGHQSSLVWVDAAPQAEALQALGDVAFQLSLAARLQGLLGSLVRVGPRAMFPMSGLEVETMGRRRIALIGEAGHVLPPIGAQGLNLGLRDAATLADCVTAAALDDPGRADIVETYARRRAGDVWTRTRAIDLLNRSLLTQLFPVEMLRGLALHAMASSVTLRRVAMRQGLEPVGQLPSLMQPPLESQPA